MPVLSCLCRFVLAERAYNLVARDARVQHVNRELSWPDVKFSAP